MELRRHKRPTPAESAEGDRGSYYAAMSRRTAIVKWAFVVAIPVFLVVMLGVYRSNITYDNLTYLLRDFRSESVNTTTVFSDVSFEDQSSFDAALFRGELAVVGSSNVTLFNSYGSKTFDYRSEMASPVAVSSDKYLFAYDLGGTKYSIYTNLTRVVDSEEDSVIENVSMAKSGAYLVTKRAKDVKYTVALYDSNFKNRANYKRGFVSDAAISPDGEHIVIVTVSNTGAALSAKLELFDFAGTGPTATYEETGFLPIRLAYFDDNSFALVCDTRIIFFDPVGKVASTFYPEAGQISCLAAGGTSICAAYTGSSAGFASEIIIFDSTGNKLYNNETDQKLYDLSFSDDFVFALGANGAYRFSRADGSVRSAVCDPEAKKIVASGSFAIVVSGTSAKCVFADEAPQSESAESAG